VIGVYLVALTVAVIYAALSCAATYQVPESTSTIPGTVLPCSTTNCGRPAVTIAAGYPACDDCSSYLTARA
jgi:hypothetical protein